jgi:hypothetical protein
MLLSRLSGKAVKIHDIEITNDPDAKKGDM